MGLRRNARTNESLVSNLSQDLTAQSDKTWSAPYRALPIFMTQANKYWVGAFLASVAIALYLPANHFHFFPPQLLPLSWIDGNVPFLPYSVWVYVSEYIFFVAVYFTCRDMVNLNKYFYSFLVLQTISVLIFLIWPTTYPREQFSVAGFVGVGYLFCISTFASYRYAS